ncbi:hypothetical protein Goari_002736, partial [Gossypium aridum]|nr:hypothetical protein [Gossypium aridum]
AWKKLKGEDTGLGWNPIKGTIDASDDFLTINLYVVATGDKARALSSSTLPSEFFEDVDNEILEKNQEENAINDVHISSQVGYPYGIPQAIKVLDSLSEEVPEASLLYFFSMKLLINKDKRIVFLSTNPNIRAWWLKMEMKESSKFCSLL